MSHAIRITAPSRIHFGLLSLHADGNARRFGGAGVMLREPAVELRVEKSNADLILGKYPQRTSQALAAWRQHSRIKHPIHCEVVHAPAEHSGLGLGTQLSLAVASGLNRLFGCHSASVETLAASVGRGLRSAVGTHGFQLGGFIAESGKRPDEKLGKLCERIALPETWRVLLVKLKEPAGLSGEAEVKAFRQLSADSPSLKADLLNELHQRLIPAARSADFEAFSESVFQYGYRAGLSFADSQHGAFRSPKIAEFVSRTRELGVLGVGQSSWGPTVFCWFPDNDGIDAFIEQQTNDMNLDAEWNVTPVNNEGAKSATLESLQDLGDQG